MMGSTGTNHDGSSGKVQGRQWSVVQGSALWCARQQRTPVCRGACEAGLGGRGEVAQATARVLFKWCLGSAGAQLGEAQ